MGSSTHLLAKRAFISVILALARAYQLIVDVNRDSDDVPIMRAFRRVGPGTKLGTTSHTLDGRWG